MPIRRCEQPHKVRIGKVEIGRNPHVQSGLGKCTPDFVTGRLPVTDSKRVIYTRDTDTGDIYLFEGAL
jgi:hypothetical protein